MVYLGQGLDMQIVMVQPIKLIFRYLENRSQIQVWLYKQVNTWIEGCIICTCNPGPASDCSRRNNLEPEQCGQGGYTRRERGQTQCG
uniref:Uncharacterized protein n=1 Tax=Bos indicus x Bos taurus TaxID=30522 RepID=A0A4W2DRW3_BOBOX